MQGMFLEVVATHLRASDSEETVKRLLIFLSSLTSPLLLVALSVSGGGCLYISYKNQGRKMQVLGKK